MESQGIFRVEPVTAAAPLSHNHGSILDSWEDTLKAMSSITRCVEVVGVRVTSEDLSDVFLSYLKGVSVDPKYSAGEVKIYLCSSYKLMMTNLLVSGTKVLDALMFMALHEDTDKNIMFEVREVKESEIDSGLVGVGERAILSYLEVVLTRGGPPESGKETSKLSKFSRRFLFSGIGEVPEYENDLSKLLSCAELKKFPNEIAMQARESHFPGVKAFVNKVRLGTAGTKCLKYAMIASTCDPSKGETELERKGRLLISLLCKRGTESFSWLDLHPHKQIVQEGIREFMRSITALMLIGLSDLGKSQFLKTVYLTAASFKRDRNLYTDSVTAEDLDKPYVPPVMNWVNSNIVHLTSINPESIDSKFKERF